MTKTKNIERADVAAELLEAAREAAVVVMGVYKQDDMGTELKGPNDPVTRADREANALLVRRLSRALPGVPIVAEESDPSTFHAFEKSREALFVDPVDGTREFVAKNGEFCVMLGFAEEGRATAGVIMFPALGTTYVGIEGEGAFLVGDDGSRSPIHPSGQTDLARCRCAVSRFHRSKRVDEMLGRLGLAELCPTGSAGLKAVRVAEGALDIYAHPSMGLVKLWDACAPDAIVTAAGGVFTDATGTRFDYRGAVAQGQGSVAANAVLHAEAIRRLTQAPPP